MILIYFFQGLVNTRGEDTQSEEGVNILETTHGERLRFPGNNSRSIVLGLGWILILSLVCFFIKHCIELFLVR